MSTKIEIELLEMRAYLTRAEFVKCHAEHDLQRFGEWRTDYDAWQAQELTGFQRAKERVEKLMQEESK